MEKLTIEVLEQALESGDFTPILAIGTIITKELLEHKKCLVGFNLLGELQIDNTTEELGIPVEFKSMDQITLAKKLVAMNLPDELIIKIMESV